jgi:hypothetical protein
MQLSPAVTCGMLRGARELGHRAFRIPPHGAGEPDRLRRAHAAAAQDHLYMNQPVKLDYLWASLCIMGAVYFVFRG